MDPILILSICIAGAVTGIVFFVLRLFTSDKDNKIINRLSQKQSVDSKAELIAKASMRSGITPFLQRIGQAAAEPFMPKGRDKQSKLRKQLGQAGIYAPGALKVMTGAKVILLVMGLGLGYAAGVASDMLMMGISAGGLLGYL